MIILNEDLLKAFSTKHADCRNQLNLWRNDVSGQKWKSARDLKKAYQRASIINSRRAVFDVGRQYRLIVEINYQKGWLRVVFIGTHDAYARINAVTVDSD